MLVGALRKSRFNLAASIRLQRSALHSSFEEPDSAERHGGLLLLAVEEAGAAAVDNSRHLWLSRRWLGWPPVAGSEVRDRRGASAVNRTPWGKASSLSQAMACQLERSSFRRTSEAASLRSACGCRCAVNRLHNKSMETFPSRVILRPSRRFTSAAARSAASECKKNAMAAPSNKCCTTSLRMNALCCSSPN